MEKFRLRQAQLLIREAVKSYKREKPKKAKEGKINVDLFEKALHGLMDAEEFIYSSRPSHQLNENEAKLFCDRLLNVRDLVDGILAEFGVVEKEDLKDEIRELSKNFLILTSKSSFKKTITKFGIQSQQIIVSGVPLNVGDMKIINPKIPDTALESIKKKIEHVKNDIKRKMDHLKLNEILVIVERDKAGKLLGERAKNLYDAQVMMVDDLKNITPDEFRDLLSKFSSR